MKAKNGVGDGVPRVFKFRAWVEKENAMWWFDLGEATQFSQEELKVWTIMQYTGYKDKHKQEIYEGDIAIEKTQDHTFVYTVVWVGACFYFQSRSGNVVHGIDTLFTEVEVIGNIYQNPNILTNNKYSEAW